MRMCLGAASASASRTQYVWLYIVTTYLAQAYVGDDIMRMFLLMKSELCKRRKEIKTGETTVFPILGNVEFKQSFPRKNPAETPTTRRKKIDRPSNRV